LKNIHQIIIPAITGPIGNKIPAITTEKIVSNTSLPVNLGVLTSS